MGSNIYVKNEMGPPSAPGTVCGGEPDHQHDIKTETYPHTHVNAVSADTDAEHPPETNYIGANASAYAGSRAHYSYPPSNVGTMQGDHAHLSPEIAGSPHQGSSGRGTPRGTNGTHQWQQGYQTPPRASTSSNLYSVMSDPQGPNGTTSTEHYGANYGTTSINGTSGSSSKRGRDDDMEVGRPDRRGLESGYDLKRRKTIRSEAMGVSMGQMPALQEIETGGGLPRQR
jgi:enhanced filamentous growth protein 1